MVKISVLPMQGVQVPSLVRELRSHVPWRNDQKTIFLNKMLKVGNERIAYISY